MEVFSLVIGCIVLMFILNFLGEVFDVRSYAIIVIMAIVFVGCFLYYTGVIKDHLDIFMIFVLATMILVVLKILIRIGGNIRRLLTTDYSSLIYNCNQDIACVKEALERARRNEEDYRLTNQFEILEPGRHKYGYNPNIYEQEVDQCKDVLDCLYDKRKYYEEQRRKSDKLKRWL